MGSATDGNGVKHPLIEHFDGALWQIDRSLQAGAADTVLNAVSAVASEDAWAVGYGTSGGTKETLAVHFDGSSWARVDSANPESGDNVLTGAAMVSGTEGFASGYGVDASGVEHAVTESFGGTAWVPADLGDVGSHDNRLLAVSATGASDVWVAGFSTSSAGVKQTEVQHFDGTDWTAATTQNAGSQDNVLNGIAARSATDVWAAGSSIPSGDSSSQTLVERDNGTQPKKLTVAKAGAGSGTVISSPAGIDCGSTCSFSFASDTQVVLTATAASGSTFGGWGGACTGTGSCTVTMDRARSVTAPFGSASPSATLSTTPSGGVQTGGGGTAGGGFPMLAVALLIGLLGAGVALRIARRA